jgi:hypothetical protein
LYCCCGGGGGGGWCFALFFCFFVAHSLLHYNRNDKPRDIFGFELHEKQVKLYREITPLKLKQALERQRAMNRVFNWYRPKDVKDLKKCTRRGIPIAHRPEVWMVASGAKKKMDAHPGLYRRLLQENLCRTSAHTVQIDKDLHRTAGHHHVRGGGAQWHRTSPARSPHCRCSCIEPSRVAVRCGESWWPIRGKTPASATGTWAGWLACRALCSPHCALSPAANR